VLFLQLCWLASHQLLQLHVICLLQQHHMNVAGWHIQLWHFGASVIHPPSELCACGWACCTGGGSVPVVYQFKTGQGDPKAAVTKLKAGIKDSKLDSVFISTNNMTFAAGLCTDCPAHSQSSCWCWHSAFSMCWYVLCQKKHKQSL
jgi:hypothetical protein